MPRDSPDTGFNANTVSNVPWGAVGCSEVTKQASKFLNPQRLVGYVNLTNFVYLRQASKHYTTIRNAESN